jgi:hypothetical protein
MRTGIYKVSAGCKGEWRPGSRIKQLLNFQFPLVVITVVPTQGGHGSESFYRLTPRQYWLVCMSTIQDYTHIPHDIDMLLC